MIQINIIRNKNQKVTTDTMEIQRNIRNYCEQPHANRMDNLEEKKFLKMYNFPRLHQEETECMKRLNISNEIESVIKKNNNKTSQQTEVQDQMASEVNGTKLSEKS